MATKQNGTGSTGDKAKKLKLQKETVRDLSPAKDIKGGGQKASLTCASTGCGGF